MPPSHEEVSEFVRAPRFNWNPEFNEEKGEKSHRVWSSSGRTTGSFWNSLEFCIAPTSFPSEFPVFGGSTGEDLGMLFEERENSFRIREQLLHPHPSSLS